MKTGEPTIRRRYRSGVFTIVLGCAGLFCGYHDGYKEIVKGWRTIAELQLQGQGGWWYAEILAGYWYVWMGGALCWLAGIMLVILGIEEIVVRRRAVRFENLMLWSALALIVTGLSISILRDAGVLRF